MDIHINHIIMILNISPSPDVHLHFCGKGMRIKRVLILKKVGSNIMMMVMRVKMIINRLVKLTLMRTLSVVYSGKWPQAVRANGHLLLNSEKVCEILI